MVGYSLLLIEKQINIFVIVHTVVIQRAFHHSANIYEKISNVLELIKKTQSVLSDVSDSDIENALLFYR